MGAARSIKGSRGFRTSMHRRRAVADFCPWSFYPATCSGRVGRVIRGKTWNTGLKPCQASAGNCRKLGGICGIRGGRRVQYGKCVMRKPRNEQSLRLFRRAPPEWGSGGRWFESSRPDIARLAVTGSYGEPSLFSWRPLCRKLCRKQAPYRTSSCILGRSSLLFSRGDFNGDGQRVVPRRRRLLVREKN